MPTKLRSDVQTELFEQASPLPEGFAYREEVLSKKEEAELVCAFEALPFKPFEFHGYLGNRRVVSFGWQYDYSGRTLRERDAIPAFLEPLRDQAADFAGFPSASLSQALVTEYAPGAGIGWHRDKPMFEDVVAFSFVSPCRLRFRRKQGDGWERAAIEAAPRSAYLLRGPARWEWYHSIPAVEALRYSVTFRNFVPDRAMTG
ncbi:MAG TPA: alpha-ketoglutarate-dependent dioxygenase AlkB [Rhizomicrobium sp.]|nr:alpha-ketoglutarate-dependent dioxygenase AlkB [Rhizomicrobium sp.]